MKKYIQKIVLIATVCFFSCGDNSDIPIDQNNLLLGDWSKAVYDGESISFERVAGLPNEEYGVSFKSSRSFIERSSGFCGTPPLVFFNTEGTWEAANSIIKIEIENYVRQFNWEIVTLNEEQLIVKRTLSEQEEDHRNLMDLFDEILNLANSKICTNVADWKITPYGAKACGGPNGYVAYHKEINEGEFLQKIETYTNEEKKYNVKWGIVSTCDVTPRPTSVQCQNDKPVLQY